MNTFANGGGAFFLYAFSFLEKEPVFKCQMTSDSTDWTIGTKDKPLETEYCSGDYNCAVDWTAD